LISRQGIQDEFDYLVFEMGLAKQAEKLVRFFQRINFACF